MENEIIYVCESINNKNVRANELKILRKDLETLSFEFGESETNVKKRFYRNEKTLNKDFEALTKMKKEMDTQKETEKNKKTADDKKSMF